MRALAFPLPLVALLLPLVALLVGCRSTEVVMLPPANRPAPRQSLQLEYPAVDGSRRPIDITYTEFGEGGDVFVLVHGMGTNADSFARIVPTLAAHGRVLAIDLPGCGQSDAPSDFAYDFPGLADVLVQFVQRAPQLARVPAATRPILVGESLGGSLSTYVTLKGLVEPSALLLSGPAGFPMDLPIVFHGARSPLGPFFLWLSSLPPQELLARQLYLRPEVVTDDVAAMLEVQRSTPERRSALHRVFKNAVDLELAAELSPRITEMPVPTLVLIGEYDPIVPPGHALRWRDALPEGTVRIVPDCGHAVVEERPERFLFHAGRFLGWPGARADEPLPAGRW